MATDPPPAPETPSPEGDYVLLTEHRVPYPEEKRYVELADANRRSRDLGRRVIVAKQQPDGSYTDMAYAGPAGWSGPGKKINPFSLTPPRRASEKYS